MGDLRIAATALKELRYAFKVFAPYRHVRKVTVFGSARTPPSGLAAGAAREFGRRLVEAGWMVITGAGEGIMGAAQEGARGEQSFGLNIRLPFEQEANAWIASDPKLITFKYFFTRKLFLVKEASALALLPGRLRHDGRGLRGPHPDADGQGRDHPHGHDRGGASTLLDAVGRMGPWDLGSPEAHRFARHVLLPHRRIGGGRGAGGDALLSRLPFGPHRAARTSSSACSDRSLPPLSRTSKTGSPTSSKGPSSR